MAGQITAQTKTDNHAISGTIYNGDAGGTKKLLDVDDPLALAQLVLLNTAVNNNSAILQQIEDNTDGLEGLITSTNSKLDLANTSLDNIELATSHLDTHEDTTMVNPSYLDSGNILAQASFTETYPAVGVGKYWEVTQLVGHAGVIYKIEVLINGSIVASCGGIANVSVIMPIPKLRLTAGQVLTIKKYNRNPALGPTGSVYSTIWYAERNA